MRIVVAPDAFKETLTAQSAARAIATGLSRAIPDCHIIQCPLADGGEGTAAVLLEAAGGEWVSRQVDGPAGEPVTASFALIDGGRTAVVDVAAAGGLPLVPRDRRDPTHATSRGTGQLIRAAMDCGARHIIVGAGGSATVDAGVGAARALGVRFLNQDGRELPEGGLALQDLHRIDLRHLDPRIRHTRIEVACDVDNPLTGPGGAAPVFAPQKGASPAQVRQLEAGLIRFADVATRRFGHRVADMKHGGAAGGLAAGFAVLFDASLVPGVEMVLDAIRFDRLLPGTTLVVTGEGRLDGQTAAGKVPAGVARRARAAGVPVVAIGGSLGDGVRRLERTGIRAWLSALARPMTLDALSKEAGVQLEACAEQLGRILLLGRDLHDPRQPHALGGRREIGRRDAPRKGEETSRAGDQ